MRQVILPDGSELTYERIYADLIRARNYAGVASLITGGKHDDDMDKLEEQRKRAQANAGHADPEQAFERFIDGLTQRPSNIPLNPNCSWCDWRRGDDPRNLTLCGFHQSLRINIRGRVAS